MTRSVVILLSALLLPQFASAKRLAPGNVEPVVYGGIRYVAPNNDGRLGYVEAWNVGTNQKPWELTIFTTSYRSNPTKKRRDNKPREGRSAGVHQNIGRPKWQAYRHIRTWNDLSGRCKHENDYAI